MTPRGSSAALGLRCGPIRHGITISSSQANIGSAVYRKNYAEFGRLGYDVLQPISRAFVRPSVRGSA
jgi:hypothetical protein